MLEEEGMSKFFFHLSAPDESFRRDDVGYDLIDLAAAHFRAKQFARRVMSFASLMNCDPDWRRWLVKVTDGSQRPVLTVIFPTRFESEEWGDDAQMNGVHALQRDLLSTCQEVTPQLRAQAIEFGFFPRQPRSLERCRPRPAGDSIIH